MSFVENLVRNADSIPIVITALLMIYIPKMYMSYKLTLASLEEKQPIFKRCGVKITFAGIVFKAGIAVLLLFVLPIIWGF